jgi:subtilisin family serine protease
MRKSLPLLAVIFLAVASPFFYPYAKNLGFDKFSSRDASANALKSKEVTGAVAKTQREAKSSVVLQKVGAGQVASVPQKPNRTVPEQASPLDRASADELKRFPTAKVLHSGAFPGPGLDQSTQVRILSTDFKYPYVRTEEVIDHATGEVLLREEMVADHLLVTLEAGQDPAMLAESMGDGVSSVERVSPDVPLFRVHLSSPTLEALPTKLDLAGEQDTVVVAEPDYIRQGLLVPNDPKYLNGTLWGLNQTSDVDVDAPEGWDVRTTAGSMVVAVIDTGIRYTHQDLAANMWVNSGEIAGNQVDDDRNGVVDDVYGLDAYNNDGDPMDDEGHGTHCAGTVGGVGNNGVGITGVAWGVKMMACKFLSNTGSGTDSDAIRCIDYARAKGAKVLSNSWGGGGANSSLLAAIERCRAAGVLFVAAAGNESNNNDRRASYPASFTTDNIISVAATTRTDGLANFSNYGATSVDLGAPGDGIYSTVSGSNSAYATYSGTSMATPHVAGALAMIAAQYPTESYSSLITRLLSGSDKIGSLSGKTKSGGRMNLAKSLGTATPPQPIRPRNDSFASATRATGSSWTFSGGNMDGTSEVGEPSHAGSAPAKSVWWVWTAPSTGTCTLSTSGSAFDTLLAVYQGTSVGALSAVASNDNSASGVTTSSVSFPVTVGAVYRIAVDGKSGASGSITLRGSVTVPGPTNDTFANAVSLSGTSFTVSGSNVGATSQVREPVHAGQRGRKSVWWSWKAPSSGTFTIATTSSTFDTLLGVYTGSVVGSLRRVGSNDDVSRSLRTSRVKISVVAGTVYRIAVDGYRGAQGTIRLAGTFQAKSTLTAPTRLRAMRNARNRVTIFWGKVQPASQYEVSLSSATQVWASGFTRGLGVRTRGSIPRSIALTAKVRAIGADGEVGPWSAPVAVR